MSKNRKIRATMLSRPTLAVSAAMLAAMLSPALVQANTGDAEYQAEQSSSWEEQSTEQSAATSSDAMTKHSSSTMASAKFEGLDQNDDGYLSEEELQVQDSLATEQGTLDTDGDGRVSRTEFAAFEPEPAMPSSSNYNSNSASEAAGDEYEREYESGTEDPSESESEWESEPQTDE